MAEVSRWIQAALSEAKKGQEEGGLPIGSVLIDPETNRIVSTGHNLRVQTGDPTAHAEMVCIKKAGRRRDWHKLVLVSTLRLAYCFLYLDFSYLNKNLIIVLTEI